MLSRRTLPLLLGAALLGGSLSACSGGSAPKVTTAQVGRADVSEVVDAPATVAARATATLRAPADGTIEKLYVSDGQQVRKGQTLALIDSPSAQEQLRQARQADAQVAAGTVAVPGVDLSTVQRQADRAARSGFAAARRAVQAIPDAASRARALAAITRGEADYALARTAAQQAVARFEQGLGSLAAAMASITSAQRVQTRAAVQAAERTVAALRLTAPFSGVVSLGGPADGGGTGLAGLLAKLPPQLPGQSASAVPGGSAGSLGGPGGAARDAASIAVGTPVSSGDAVVTVTDVSTLSLTADVDETDVLSVHPGVPADVELDAVPGATYQAMVTGVGVAPQQSSGGGVSYPVTLSLGPGRLADGSAAPRPKPGMSADVRLRVRDVRDVLAVPSAALVTNGSQSTVWVVDASGRARRRIVEVGAQGDAVVQIVTGLRAGERVVVRGADTVHEGQRLPGT